MDVFPIVWKRFLIKEFVRKKILDSQLEKVILESF